MTYEGTIYKAVFDTVNGGECKIESQAKILESPPAEWEEKRIKRKRER